MRSASAEGSATSSRAKTDPPPWPRETHSDSAAVNEELLSSTASFTTAGGSSQTDMASSFGMLSKTREDPVLDAATSSPPDPLPLLLANPALGIEDLTRRSDSPVANSPSKSSSMRPAGSASVTSPVQIAPSPLRDPMTGARIGPLAQQQQQNQGTGVSHLSGLSSEALGLISTAGGRR